MFFNKYVHELVTIDTENNLIKKAVLTKSISVANTVRQNLPHTFALHSGLKQGNTLLSLFFSFSLKQSSTMVRKSDGNESELKSSACDLLW